MKSHPGTSVLARKYLTFAIAAVMGLGAAYPQQQGQRDLDELAISLPENAIWRFESADEKPNNGFFRLKFSRDGRLLAARTKDNVVELRNVDSKKLLCKIGEHKSKIEFIDFSVDSNFLLIVDAGAKRVSIWDTRTGTLEKEIECEPLVVISLLMIRRFLCIPSLANIPCSGPFGAIILQLRIHTSLIIVPAN